MNAPAAELAQAAELTRLTAERDAALAEVQRLSEAISDLLPYLEDLVNHGDVLGSRKMVEMALPSLRALVSSP